MISAPMPTYQETYARHADRYDALVRREDHRGALPALLARVLSARPGGLRPRLAIELGCGTGRVTRLLAPLVEQVRAFDGSAHMIDYARASLSPEVAPNVAFGVADHASLPAPTAAADVVVAGWTLGHYTGFHPDDWRAHATRALAEMRRVAAPAGAQVVIETLGTCAETPAPPNARLAAFYELLERGHGFRREVIATDYAFPSCDEAARVMGDFFGPAMADAVRARGAAIVPEFTGVWIAAPA